MSEERFDRIEQRLDRLEVGQNALKADVSRIDAKVTGLEQRLDGVDQRLDGLDQRLGDLDRHMHVLHEQVLDKLAVTREYNGPTREEFAELKEMIGRRLDPLEAVVRQHSIDIAQLKQKCG